MAHFNNNNQGQVNFIMKILKKVKIQTQTSLYRVVQINLNGLINISRSIITITSKKSIPTNLRRLELINIKKKVISINIQKSVLMNLNNSAPVIPNKLVVQMILSS